MSDEQPKLHPLTELMLARMESHPEEFPDGVLSTKLGNMGTQRWYQAVHAIDLYASDADREALKAKLNTIWLNAAHEWAMDELLNGEERRKHENGPGNAWVQHAMLAQAQTQTPYGQATATGVLGGSGDIIPVSRGGGGGTSPTWYTYGSVSTTPSLLDRLKGKLGI